MSADVKNIGLRGVAVADTRISHVDGSNGILIYRGYRIEDLVAYSTFEETAYLLLHDKLPSSEELATFKRQLAGARDIPGFIYDALGSLPKTARPMDVLQASVPLLAMCDSDLEAGTREGNIAMAGRLITRIPVVVAGWERIRKGLPLVSSELPGHAENFLWQLNGTKPDPDIARDLDTVLVLHADHSFNASTFACREVASTLAHMYAAVTAGVGALSGSLHGGANMQVMKMLTEIRHEKDVAGWVKRELDSGRRIMGMGHAVYKTTDPRAAFLKEMCFRIGRKLANEELCRLSAVIESAALAEFERRGKMTIKPNVDFYSAPVYHLMGIPHDMMTAVFAVSRIAGWTAHIIEEKFGEAQGKPVLYRPSSEYIGSYCGRTGCVYTPIEKRI